MLQILQTEIFQFALQFIETQFVGEWGIEVTGFLADFLLASSCFVSLICRITFTRSAIMMRITRMSSENEMSRFLKFSLSMIGFRLYRS